MVHEQQDRLTADVATLRVQMFGNYIVSKGATRRGAEGAQAPLSHHDIDVIFLYFQQKLKSRLCALQITLRHYHKE